MAGGRGVLAIDHGSRKTGFAASDPLRIATRPLGVFRGPGDGPELLEHVAALVREHDAGTLVVGWPVEGGGREGARCAEVRRFVERLRERLPEVRLVLHAEHLTTKEAESLMAERGLSRREAREARDAWAALVLLRDWIESGEPERSD